MNNFSYSAYNLSSFYLKFLVIFVSLLGGWFGHELSQFNYGNSLISLFYYKYVMFSVSI
jgi:hypothetical protein